MDLKIYINKKNMNEICEHTLSYLSKGKNKNWDEVIEKAYEVPEEKK